MKLFGNASSLVPRLMVLLILGGGAVLPGCASDAPLSQTSESTDIQESRHSLNVPEDGLARTLAPLRKLQTPGSVYMKTLRQTYPGTGVFPQTIHVYQPDGISGPISFELSATTASGTVDTSHTFQSVLATSHPGEADETPQPYPNGSGLRTYSWTSSIAGWYRFSFQYHAPNPNRVLSFRAFDSQGTPLKIVWSDPSGNNVQVRATVKVEQAAQTFFKGGAYRTSSASEYAYIDNVKVDGSLLYRRGFDQGPFNYPLGRLSAADHTLEFSFTASGTNPAYLWFGVDEQSFDKSGIKNEWAPVQFLYRGAMHTADYDAWREGVAFAQGSTLVSGVRPPPVRRGTTFGLELEDTSLNGSWSNAILRIYPWGSSSQVSWTSTLSPAGDYLGGIWTAGGFSARYRENWTVQVPGDAAVGKYVVRAYSPWGYQIGQDVLFYVIHNPYSILASGGLTKQELETFAYDEDEDGVTLSGNYGPDLDSTRDNFTALYDWVDQGSYSARPILTAAFRRTQAETSFSMLDVAMAASHGTATEFESMRRLYRVLVQRLSYNHYSPDDDSSVTFMQDGSDYTPDLAAAMSQSGTEETNPVGGQCHDYGSILTALARASGIVSRVISDTSGTGGWSLHYFTEVYIPDLPHQGGKTSASGTTDSDTDHWYVFDATDPSSSTFEFRWYCHAEAIAPRAEYGKATTLTTSIEPGDWIVATTKLDWDPTFSGNLTPTDLLSVADAYYSPGRQYWLTSAGAAGWIGFGDKDVYRVSKEATGATGVHVQILPSGDQTLTPVLCVGPTSIAAPEMLDVCASPGQTVDLPAGESYVVVFNNRPDPIVYQDGEPKYSRVLRGDTVAYQLELLYGNSPCTDATSVDMGVPGTTVSVSNNRCLKVTQYPNWWGTRQMQLQNMTPGSYPVPFNVSNCGATKGTGTITADWQSFYINNISQSCTTFVKLGGDGRGNVTLRYFAM
jgi:hypothetical protein